MHSFYENLLVVILLSISFFQSVPFYIKYECNSCKVQKSIFSTYIIILTSGYIHTFKGRKSEVVSYGIRNQTLSTTIKKCYS